MVTMNDKIQSTHKYAHRSRASRAGLPIFVRNYRNRVALCGRTPDGPAHAGARPLIAERLGAANDLIER
jgi:hypothetical protein